MEEIKDKVVQLENEIAQWLLKISPTIMVYCQILTKQILVFHLKFVRIVNPWCHFFNVLSQELLKLICSTVIVYQSPRNSIFEEH